MSLLYLSFAGSNLNVSAFCCDVINDFSNILRYNVPISLFSDARRSMSCLSIFHAMVGSRVSIINFVGSSLK